MNLFLPSHFLPKIMARLWAVAGLVFCAAAGAVHGADTNQPPSAAKPSKPEKKILSGADLYAMHCNRCHPERYATEWTAAQWKTIMTHMRVRANLPASQAKMILKFLQEDAGS
jgi:hypothetical protein